MYRKGDLVDCRQISKPLYQTLYPNYVLYYRLILFVVVKGPLVATESSQPTIS